MKKLFLLLAFVGCYGMANAQWVDNGATITTNDDVEINGNATLFNNNFFRSYRSDGVTPHQAFGMDGNNDIIFNRSAIVGSQKSALVFASADRPIDFRDKNNTVFVRVLPNGNMGVGTISPQSKLSIKGNLESEEVQVKQTVADYVFKKDYKLMSLSEIESFISENGHLPRIQTQKDVDENRGLVKLGDLSVSLMEKVEELTLHMIEMDKRIKSLEEENKDLKESLNKK